MGQCLSDVVQGREHESCIDLAASKANDVYCAFCYADYFLSNYKKHKREEKAKNPLFNIFSNSASVFSAFFS